MGELLDLNFDLDEFFARNSDKNCRALLAQIREWIEKNATDTDIPKNLTDAQIVIFLANCDFNVVSTQKKLQKYYTLRKSAAYLFTNRNVCEKEIESQLQIFRAGISPHLTEDGCRVLIIKMIDSLPEQYLMEAACRLGFMMLDYLIYSGHTKGVVVVYDIKHIKIGHLARVRLGAMRYFFQYVQDCIPMKFVKIHVINTVPFIDKIMTLIKPFLRGELLKALEFHSTGMSWDQFHSYLPEKHLPVEYEGSLGKFDGLNAELVGNLEKMHAYFEQEEAQRVFDRKIKVKETQDSFKHLSID